MLLIQLTTSSVSKSMSFKIFIHVLKNALIKRKRNVILPNYINQLFVLGCSKSNQSNRKTANRTNPNRNRKNRIWSGCIQINFLLNRMVWFGLRFWFYQPNQTKPNCNIRKTLIKYISFWPIFIETQWKL